MRSSRFDFYRVLEQFPIAIPDNEHTSTLLTDTTFGIAVPTQTRRGYIVFKPLMKLRFVTACWI